MRQTKYSVERCTRAAEKKQESATHMQHLCNVILSIATKVKPEVISDSQNTRTAEISSAFCIFRFLDVMDHFSFTERPLDAH